MIVRTPPEGPAEKTLRFCDRTFIDAGMAALHQAVFDKFPILVAIGAKPVSAVIMILVSIANRDTIAAICPKFLD